MNRLEKISRRPAEEAPNNQNNQRIESKARSTRENLPDDGMEMERPKRTLTTVPSPYLTESASKVILDDLARMLADPNAASNEIKSTIKNFSSEQMDRYRSEKDDPLLSIVIQSGKINELKELLKRGLNVNVQGNRKLTPLHYAILLGDESKIEVLVEKGAYSNIKAIKSCGHYTALDFAAQFNPIAERQKQYLNLLDELRKYESGSIAFTTIDYNKANKYVVENKIKGRVNDFLYQCSLPIFERFLRDNIKAQLQKSCEKKVSQIEKKRNSALKILLTNVAKKGKPEKHSGEDNGLVNQEDIVDPDKALRSALDIAVEQRNINAFMLLTKKTGIQLDDIWVDDKKNEINVAIRERSSNSIAYLGARENQDLIAMKNALVQVFNTQVYKEI